jgi:hypothetical protein
MPAARVAIVRRASNSRPMSPVGPSRQNPHSWTCVRFQGEAEVHGRSAQTLPVEIDPSRTRYVAIFEYAAYR